MVVDDAMKVKKGSFASDIDGRRVSRRRKEGGTERRKK